jgi:hypothetical protein
LSLQRFLRGAESPVAVQRQTTGKKDGQEIGNRKKFKARGPRKLGRKSLAFGTMTLIFVT